MVGFDVEFSWDVLIWFSSAEFSEVRRLDPVESSFDEFSPWFQFSGYIHDNAGKLMKEDDGVMVVLESLKSFLKLL